MRTCLKTFVCFTLVAMLIFTAITLVGAETEERELYYNNDFIYEILPDDTITIHYYIGNTSQVTVPSYIDSIPVVSIEEWAFYGTTVKDVHICEGVTTLKNEAFFYSRGLESVTLPSTLETVGQGAFRDCTSLKTVAFTNNAGALGNYMFYGCTRLEDINLPDSVTNIPTGTFSYCQSLKKISLPEYLDTIYDYAFYNCGLTTVELPLYLQNIHQKAFAECVYLAEIICVNTEYTYVATDAFENCIAEFPYFTFEETTTDPTEPSVNPSTPTDPNPPPVEPPEATTGLGICGTETTESSTVAITTEPYESSTPGDYIPDKDFYMGEFDEFILYESSKISSARDTVTENRKELLELAWNVRTVGDANNDGKVNVKDATHIQRYVASLIDEDSPDFNYKNSDVDTDGKITVKDATTIQKYIAGLIDSLY